MNLLPRYNEKGELDTRLRVDPITGDVGIGTPKEKEHMTKDEALQLALGSMKEIIHWYAVRDRNDVFLNFVDQNPEIQKIMKSITAIKEALETKDEPVAWMSEDEHTVYTSKQVDGCFQHDHIPLYTTPQRTWVGLTEEEIQKILGKFYAYNPRLLSFAQEIQANLKEKNGY